MLTPSRYWRVARCLSDMESEPPQEFQLPDSLTSQKSPPRIDDGVMLADYDEETQTGLLKYLGIIRGFIKEHSVVEWVSTNTEIWVDTPAGRGNWNKKPGFKFAESKVAGYGLHELFSDAFPDLEPREDLPNEAKAVRARRTSTNRSISRERLEPVEIIGQPTDSPRGGYVYVLKSAYGFKVGRTKNIPSRMRAFGVKLPFMYTIPFCVWFDDHIEAESSYHRRFSEKRINGEWFDLEDNDISLIRNSDF